MKTNLFVSLCVAVGLWFGGTHVLHAQELPASGGLAAEQKAVQLMENKIFEPVFPQGNPLPEQFACYFIGQAYLAPLTQNGALNVPVANVTFEPGCRNNWHSHTGGQLLLCTAGRGYYQEQGAPARELRPGDVVEIAPDVVHWHGAAPDSWFSHLAIECNPQSNVNTWLGPVDDAHYAAATAPTGPTEPVGPVAADWQATDPELAAILSRFVTEEVEQYGSLDRRQRDLVTLAACVAQHAVTEFRTRLGSALDGGLPPREAKELIYHAVPYVGWAKAADCLQAANEVLAARGVALPLDAQARVTAESRFAEGLAVQKAIFGPTIDQLHQAAPENQKHIQNFLTANCFGDYQTRPAFDAPMRELLTFALLISLGGCEPQVKAHIAGNRNVGNDKETLLAVATQLLPWNGYPRTLNAIACLNEVIPEK